VLLRLQFIILVPCCCFSLMNHDVTVSTTLCCRVLTLVCCLSVHAVPGFIGTWLPNTYRTFGSLALGCPTHYLAYGSPRSGTGCPTLPSGTWLPNSTPFSTLRHVTSWHNCAQHAFRSICCTYYLISLDELHLGCDTLRHLLFIRSGGYMCCTIDIFYFVYMIWLTVSIYHQRSPLHSMLINMMSFFHVHCYWLAVSLLAHLLIRTSTCSAPCIYRLSVMWQHQMLCHDVTVFYDHVLVSDL